jgi:dephospho-CoA kinase
MNGRIWLLSKRWPEKVLIGLTGNIATGKSTILQLAQEQGALTLDADAAVHEILATDPGAQQAIVDAFGPEIRQPDGAINRVAMASIVFSDEDSLSLLEQILHPRVRRRLFKKIDRSAQDVVLIEAIKLLEGGLSDECDQIWVTRCSVATQVERLMTYRDLDEETALMRINAQSSQRPWPMSSLIRMALWMKLGPIFIWLGNACRGICRPVKRLPSRSISVGPTGRNWLAIQSTIPAQMKNHRRSNRPTRPR